MELLLSWLNDDLKLSRTVDDFTSQFFRNGLLFGEILHKHNQQSDFKRFSKKTVRASGEIVARLEKK